MARTCRALRHDTIRKQMLAVRIPFRLAVVAVVWNSQMYLKAIHLYIHILYIYIGDHYGKVNQTLIDIDDYKDISYL